MAGKIFPQCSETKDAEVTLRACWIVFQPKAGARGENGTKLMSFSEKVYSYSGDFACLYSPYIAFVKV